MSDLDNRVSQYFQKYDETVTAGDIEAFMATQSADVVWNPPDRESVVGQDALRKYAIDEWFDVYSMNLKSTVEEAIPLSDEFTSSRGTWKIDLTPKAEGEPATLHGTFLWLLNSEGEEITAKRMSFSIIE